MKKNLIFWFVLLAYLMAPTRTFAYDVEIDGIYYNLDRNAKTAEVTYKDTTYGTYSGTVIIPSSITCEGGVYEVKSIGMAGFFDCMITSITLPNSITTIGQQAFEGCINLSSISIPNSVSSIGLHAFSNSGLTSITIPKSVISISGNPFIRCI